MSAWDSVTGFEIMSTRQRLGVTQPDIVDFMRARGFDWSQHRLTQIERGRSSLKAREVEPLAMALGISPAEILGMEEYEYQCPECARRDLNP